MNVEIAAISGTPGATAGVLEFCSRPVPSGDDSCYEAYVTFLPSHDAPRVPAGMRSVRLTVRGQLPAGSDPAVRNSLEDTAAALGQSLKFSAETGRYEIRKSWIVTG